jgi:hypothetical protein
MFPSTVDRVPHNTSESVNQWIRQQTEQNIAHHAHGGRDAISQRLTELDNEWDIERLLEANAASVVLLGVALGTFVDKRFFFLPAVVGTFLLQHALQGWCPPVPVFRRLGVRTQSEIDQEKYALKAMRGDFRHVQPNDFSQQQASQAMRAAQ